MGFGYSVGDIIAVSTLAWKVYRSCKDAPASFQNIAGDISSMHAVLTNIAETLEELTRLDRKKKDTLTLLRDACEQLLSGIDACLARFRSLGTQSTRTRDRLRWSQAAVDDVRARLPGVTARLALFSTHLPS